MKCIAFVLFVIFCGCVSVNTNNTDICDVNIPVELVRTNQPNITITTVFKIGYYNPNPNEYGFKNINIQKTYSFLEQQAHKFKEGEVVVVDGLQWKRSNKRQLQYTGFEINPISKQILMRKSMLDVKWEPYSNSPKPVYNKKHISFDQYIIAYNEWINKHPHFGCIPL